MNDIDDESSVKVFPNPATDYIEMSELNGGAKVSIYDMTGRKVYEAKDFGISKIDIRTLRNGSYTISIEQNNSVQHIKFIKTE